MYWVLGTACAGKSTLCAYLADKFDMFYYDADTTFGEHLKISNPIDQPAMNIDRSDWDVYFDREPKVYAKWLENSINEQLDLIIADLMTMSRDKKIIVDAHCYNSDMTSISDYNRILYITSDFSLVEEQFFKRDDKNDLYALIQTLKNPEVKFQNLYNTFSLSHIELYNRIIKGKSAYYIRNKDTQVKDMADFAAKHFGFP